tara:strand:+ start:91 stop:1587 length:1497 start_codon:yes stop_codon:yes gene_type:complete
MNWKNRKLFNTLPQGIVSGLEPIPRYQMGGMVQGYETGGPFPNKGLAALNKVAPEVVKKMGYEDGGFINPRNYLGGGTVEYPIGMEAGTLVPEVFESGDQQINEALNTMVATTMPTGDAVPSMAIEEPTGDVAEIIPETTTGDSSSKESLFIAELNEQKKVLQDTIEKVVAEKTQEGLDPITLESQITDFITKADSLFKRKVTEIANKLNVEVMPEQITLLTDDFSTKLETMFPSIAALDSDEDMQVATAEESDIVTMEHGGVVNAAAIKENETKIAELNAKLGPMPSGSRKQRNARQQIENQIRALQRELQELRHPLPGKNKRPKKTKEVITPKKEEVITPEKEEKEILETSTVTPDLRELLANNARNVETAALMTGKSKQGGVSGFMDVLGQANLLGAKAERENLLKQLEIEGQTTALGDKYDEAAFASVVDQLDETGALEFYVLSGRPLPKSRQGVIPAGKFNNRNFSEHLAFIRSTDKNTPFETIVANFRAKAA